MKMVINFIKVFAGLIVLIICVIGVHIGYAFYETRNHISRYDASYEELMRIPYLVKNKDGTLYTGIIYDTYFSDRFLDVKQWEGSFKNGKPSGKFTFFLENGSVKSESVYGDIIKGDGGINN